MDHDPLRPRTREDTAVTLMDHRRSLWPHSPQPGRSAAGAPLIIDHYKHQLVVVRSKAAVSAVSCFGLRAAPQGHAAVLLGELRQHIDRLQWAPRLFEKHC